MMWQGTFLDYNLGPPESERQRQLKVHCSNIEIPKTCKHKKKVHKQMNGQRRRGRSTEWNSSHWKKMNNAIFSITHEPRNNHIRLT